MAVTTWIHNKMMTSVPVFFTGSLRNTDGKIISNCYQMSEKQLLKPNLPQKQRAHPTVREAQSDLDPLLRKEKVPGGVYEVTV